MTRTSAHWLAHVTVIALISGLLTACGQPAKTDSTAALVRENKQLKSQLSQVRAKRLVVTPTSFAAGKEGIVQDLQSEPQFGITLKAVTNDFSAQGETIIAADTRGVVLTARKGVQVTVTYHNYARSDGFAPRLTDFTIRGFDDQPGQIVKNQMAGGGRAASGTTGTMTFWAEMPSFKGSGSPFTISYQSAGMLVPLCFTTTLTN
ncbi:hypothetical protein [Lacticaseibacillus absianus]|uniref:hypothetical protein n=1 Tax=Lacticaseibacillus absianus TaxID=2729623 RepID=UPI0015CEE21D|nr:hypothetical protein [Lacticaseibacillus absianus]